MTAPAKETLSRWLPSIAALTALLVHVVAISRWSATVDARQDASDARMARIETKAIPIERLYELFPSRAEWHAKIQTRNIEMADLKVMVRETNAKVDQLYQLQLRRESGVTQ